jgi:glycerate 2-kinase
MTYTEAQADSQNLTNIFNAALAAVDPYNAVLKAAKVDGNQLHVADAKYDLAAFERVVVVGGGKATARMALAIETLLGKKISAGLIVVKDGHTAQLSIIEQVESSHPVPGEAGLAGTTRVLEKIGRAHV